LSQAAAPILDPGQKRGCTVEAATPEEIDIGGLRDFFLDDFHKVFGKEPSQKTLGPFSTATHSADGD